MTATQKPPGSSPGYIRKPHKPIGEKPKMVNGHDDQTQQPLNLTFFEDCEAFVDKRYIFKGLLALGETSAWVAPPGKGKSATLAEISIDAAAKIGWRGHRAMMACGVVYFALERAGLVKRRLHAHAMRDGFKDLPIAVAGSIIDLLDISCVDIIVSTVRAAERHYGCNVGLIVIDTFSKGIAAGGGDEDKARDQNRAATNLARVHSVIDVHIALIGHTGKDETRGARGSNAHLGDVDVMVQISGETAVKTVAVVKANDQAERVIAQFAIESFEVGRDGDGEAITVGILSADEVEGPVTDRGKKRKLKAKEEAAIRALFDLIADGETVLRPENIHAPVGVTCVTRAIFRERLKNRRIINPEGSYREEFNRLCVTLQNAGIIGAWEDFVWRVTCVTK